LPGCSHSASSQNGLPDSIEETSISEEILDVGQLKMMGDHFLQVLLKMKHNGAIDKTRAGFTALCNRLLCSNDSRYVQFLQRLVPEPLHPKMGIYMHKILCCSFYLDSECLHNK
jgi:thyroid adenoma-associated protein